MASFPVNNGPLAHLVEHLICTEGVAGSSPVGSTNKIKDARLSVFYFVCGEPYLDEKAGAHAGARGGVEQIFSRKLCVTESVVL